MVNEGRLRAGQMGVARAVRLWLATMLTLIALHAFGPAGLAQAEGQVHLLTIDGVINPLTAQYLTRELRKALDKIFAVVRNVDSKTMSLQYLDTLKALGTAPATKLVLPVEFTSLLRPFLDQTAKDAER